jgi:mannose-6-phosphate isomerase-like protein (cupin superfamily)
MTEEQSQPVLQVFDIGSEHEENGRSSRNLAKSANCYINCFEVEPRAGETRVHSHPDSDQILFAIEGDCTVEGLTGRYLLHPNQGVLVPAGTNYSFTNTTEKPLIFLSLRTCTEEGSGGRRVAYVPSVPSDVGIKVPAAQISAQGIGTHLYVYALDGATIGVSPLLHDDWNRATILRMEATYENAGDSIVAVVPERLADWYRLDDLTEGDYTITPDPDGTRVTINITPAIERQIHQASHV